MDNNSKNIALKICLKFVEAWLFTCRFVLEADPSSKAMFDKKRQVIVALWHCGLIYILYHFRKFPAAIMVSASKDGEWVARALRLWGQYPVRGSRLKGGLYAIRDMTRLLKKYNLSAGIVADGSKGPALKAQIGAIILARDTGLPIIPVSMDATPAYRFNSWDRLILPLPFSKVAMVYGAPIYVGKEVKGKKVEEKRSLLENMLNEAHLKAKEILGYRNYQ